MDKSFGRELIRAAAITAVLCLAIVLGNRIFGIRFLLGCMYALEVFMAAMIIYTLYMIITSIPHMFKALMKRIRRNRPPS